MGCERNVPNYLFQVEYLHRNFLAQGKLCVDAQMLQGKCIQIIKLAYVMSACLSHGLFAECAITSK